MTIHVSGVSLAARPSGWLLERLSGRVHRAPGTPLRECPPAFGLLLYFVRGVPGALCTMSAAVTLAVLPLRRISGGRAGRITELS